MPPRQVFLIGWTGLRGVVSLAAALALPLAVQSGQPFPYRAEIVVIAFVVILVTLVLQGLTLPAAGAAAPAAQGSPARARGGARAGPRGHGRTRAARPRIGGPGIVGRGDRTPARSLHGAAAATAEGRRHDRPHGEDEAALRQLRAELLLAERRALVELRDREVISDEVLSRLEHELNLEAMRAGLGEVPSPAAIGDRASTIRLRSGRPHDAPPRAVQRRAAAVLDPPPSHGPLHDRRELGVPLHVGSELGSQSSITALSTMLSGGAPGLLDDSENPLRLPRACPCGLSSEHARADRARATSCVAHGRIRAVRPEPFRARFLQPGPWVRTGDGGRGGKLYRWYKAALGRRDRCRRYIGLSAARARWRSSRTTPSELLPAAGRRRCLEPPQRCLLHRATRRQIPRTLEFLAAERADARDRAA